MQRQSTLANRGGTQQVLDQALQPECASVHGSQHAFDLLGIQVQKVFGQQLGRCGQCGQRTTQLVSDSAENPSPQTNPSQAGFLGDYSSIAASTAPGSSLVYPNWSDTRNLSAAGVPDEDVFIGKVTLP